MTIDEGLRAFLAAVVGEAAAVYSHRAPQQTTTPADATPYVVIFRISASPKHSHAGPMPELERTFQVATYAKQQSIAIGLSDQMRRALDGYRGVMGDVPVRACYWSTDYYTFDSATQLHQFSTDYRIHYREAT